MDRVSLSAVVVLSSLAATSCSSGVPLMTTCSAIKSEARIAKSDPTTMDYLLNQRAAPGGELIIEFRRNGVLQPVSHQKKCSFFLEPSATSSDATMWTASHCLDLSIDSGYRLRFYMNSSMGYAEVPVDIAAVRHVTALRKALSKRSSDSQKTFLEALRPSDIDYSVSKNGEDICLNSFKTGYGWSLFHHPEKDKNQIACFLYHDLALVPFSLAASATVEQKSIFEQMLNKARIFDASNRAHPNAVLVRDGDVRRMSDFRAQWVETYKTYTGLRSQSGFAKFADTIKTTCAESGRLDNPTLCKDADALADDLTASGFSQFAELLSADGQTAYKNAYANIVPEISKLWKYYSNATITVDNTTVRPYAQFNILTNFSWNGGKNHSYSSIPLMGFVGLDWGSVTDPHSGIVRARTGAATYHWLQDGTEMFIYAIFPKQQTQENLAKGFGQITLKPGDSGTLVLADGLPMAVLSTVDGQKTSGGSSILPLPEIDEAGGTALQPLPDPNGGLETADTHQGLSGGVAAEADARATVVRAKSQATGCIN